jgi:hypothetical protein
MVNGRNGLFRTEPVTVLPGWLALRKSVLSYLERCGNLIGGVRNCGNLAVRGCGNLQMGLYRR